VGSRAVQWWQRKKLPASARNRIPVVHPGAMFREFVSEIIKVYNKHVREALLPLCTIPDS
jgi:hypothetical protein